jgi:acyl-CoA dehydrogenase
MVGAMEAILSLTLDYVKERRQFGRPLARFQTIQQSLALMAVEVAAARMAVQAGFLLSQPWSQPFAAAAAKSRVSEAAQKVAAIAHQTHGAMGFTAEYRLHLFTKRLWAWRERGGNEFYWNERLGQLIAERDEPGLWAMMTALDS